MNPNGMSVNYCKYEIERGCEYQFVYEFLETDKFRKSAFLADLRRVSFLFYNIDSEVYKSSL